jgi:hypothetical protein
MASLNQLAQTSNRTTTNNPVTNISGSSAGGAKSNPNQVLDTISSDIAKLTGGAQKVTQAKYEATEFADKMRASDRLQKYNESMVSMNNYYAEREANGHVMTVEDYQNRKDWEEGIYKYYVETGITENDSKSPYFKEMFMKPAYKTLNASKNKLNNGMRVQFGIENTARRKEEFMNAENMTSVDQADAEVMKESALGNPKAKQVVHADVATAYNATFAGVNPMNIDLNDIEGELEYHYGGWLKVDSEGNYSKADPRIDDSAYESMLNSWEAGIAQAARAQTQQVEKSNSLVKEYLGDSASISSGMTAYEVKSSIDKGVSEMNRLLKLDPTYAGSSRHQADMYKLNEANMMYVVKADVENAYKSGDADYLISLATNGKEYTRDVYNVQTGESTTVEETIKQEQIKTIISSMALKDYNQIKNNGASQEQAYSYGVKFAKLQASDAVDSKIATSIKSDFNKFGINGLNSASSVEQLTGTINMVAGYFENAEDGLVKRNVMDKINAINTFRIQQEKLLEVQPDMPANQNMMADKNKLLSDMKSMTQQLFKREAGTDPYKGIPEAGKQILIEKFGYERGEDGALTIDSDKLDSLLSGLYDAGTSADITGTTIPLMFQMLSDDEWKKVEAGDMSPFKGKIVRVDESFSTPFFSTSQVVINPAPELGNSIDVGKSITVLTAKRMKELGYIDAEATKLGKSQKDSFLGLRSGSNIRITQVENPTTHNVDTIVNVYEKGKMIYSDVYDKEELISARVEYGVLENKTTKYEDRHRGSQ